MRSVTVEGFKRTCKTSALTGEGIIGWGGPGIGKTTSPAQAMAELSKATGEQWDTHVLVATDYSPADFRGLPKYTGEGDNQRTMYCPEDGLVPIPGEYCRPCDRVHGEKGLFIVDEFNLCVPEVQNVFRKGSDERHFGGLRIADGWTFLFLCNRASDRAGVYEIPAPLISRFSNIGVEADADEVARYLLRKDTTAMPGYNTTAAYLGWKPSHVYTFDSDVDGPYACPRTWEKVSKILRPDKVDAKKADDGKVDQSALDLDNETEDVFVTGLLGDAVAAEFLTFRRLRSQIPDVNGILAGREKPPCPEAIDAAIALASVLAERAKDRKKMEHTLQYAVDRMSGEVAGYYGHHLVRQPVWTDMTPKEKRELFRTEAWRAYSREHGDVL